eukprot:CAMPEP_0177516006 /NCGR_PEP_ID=MMETSP0369-20130122/45173_1 /TAXON_ID=447022 ORGANISM="Scrippsiella hangoei-like, Strain SHHI-4" /NCGR_SAMPLE_ID=MMETSP0369 /ASSEMBLY_ACC=CAM_ASM_000364 /LENGTH=51 /DNA_ID=CAMNT_0018994841 /DNA_START=82 /DNA_END=237 /DNA_ORIENTATION=-
MPILGLLPNNTFTSNVIVEIRMCTSKEKAEHTNLSSSRDSSEHPRGHCRPM